MEDRWSRTRILIGQEGLDRLSASRVMVVGVGGVGSFAAEALARAGIGSLDLVDGDVVVASNLNRQIMALCSTIGRPKVEVMRERILDINPACQVTAFCMRYDREKKGFLESRSPDYVVDAIDAVPDKISLISHCLALGIPVVSSMGAGNRLDPCALEVADISETSVCPLARKVRHELKKMGIKNGVKVVFSKEPPLRSKEGPVGSLSFVPGAAGLILASVVVRDLLQGNKS